MFITVSHFLPSLIFQATLGAYNSSTVALTANIILGWKWQTRHAFAEPSLTTEKKFRRQQTDPAERLQKPISTISGWEQQSQKSVGESSASATPADETRIPDEERFKEEEPIDDEYDEVSLSRGEEVPVFSS